MSDTFTESTPEGFLSRGKNSIIGVFFGLAMFVGSVFLLAWNEHRAITQIHTLEEGKKIVVTIASGDKSLQTEGRLVFTTGTASTSENLKDPIFSVSDRALRLKRKVEIYQWEETKETEGSGSNKRTTYSYHKKWSEKLEHSASFHASGHDNPSSMPFRTEEIDGQSVNVGAHTLSSGLLRQINEFRPLPVTLAAASSAPRAGSLTAKPDGAGLYYGQDSSRPEIGDMRVSFFSIHPLEVSLVAQQSGSTFQPYQTQAGNTIELLETGTHDSDYVFSVAAKRNATTTWILRGVGWLIMFIATMMILGPLRFLADMIPFLGSLFDFGFAMLAFLFSALVASLVVATAWFAVRPLAGAIGIGLIAIAIWGSVRKHRGYQQNLAAANAASSMPPPPPPGAR